MSCPRCRWCLQWPQRLWRQRKATLAALIWGSTPRSATRRRKALCKLSRTRPAPYPVCAGRSGWASIICDQGQRRMSHGRPSVRRCCASFVASRVVASRCALSGAAFRMRWKGADSPPTRAMPAPLDPYPAARPPSFPSTGPYLAWYARHRPDPTAVFEDGHSVSYAVLARDVAKTARELEQLGIRAGSLVGIELRPQRYLILLLLLACEVIGATVSPLQQNDLRDDDPIAPCCDFFLLASQPLMYAAKACFVAERSV
jgi:AMP-binding enzyme